MPLSVEASPAEPGTKSFASTRPNGCTYADEGVLAAVSETIAAGVDRGIWGACAIDAGAGAGAGAGAVAAAAGLRGTMISTLPRRTTVVAGGASSDGGVGTAIAAAARAATAGAAGAAGDAVGGERGAAASAAGAGLGWPRRAIIRGTNKGRAPATAAGAGAATAAVAGAGEAATSTLAASIG
jgi:hypothetical protein